MSDKLRSLLKFGWRLDGKAMVDKDYHVQNLSMHARAMLNTADSLDISDHFKRSLHRILNQIQYSKTASARGHYYGMLNEWLNTAEEKYKSTDNE